MRPGNLTASLNPRKDCNIGTATVWGRSRPAISRSVSEVRNHVGVVAPTSGTPMLHVRHSSVSVLFLVDLVVAVFHSVHSYQSFTITPTPMRFVKWL